MVLIRRYVVTDRNSREAANIERFRIALPVDVWTTGASIVAECHTVRITNPISSVLAQDPKPAEQKPTAPAAAESKKPKTEVDKLITEASKRGEKVLTVCIDPANCGAESNDQSLNLESGRAVHLPIPAYPPIALAAHAQGSVEVQVIIDEDGR